jgi:hypothetical protein
LFPNTTKFWHQTPGVISALLEGLQSLVIVESFEVSFVELQVDELGAPVTFASGNIFAGHSLNTSTWLLFWGSGIRPFAWEGHLSLLLWNAIWDHSRSNFFGGPRFWPTTA